MDNNTMYTILINNDHSFTHSQKKRIMKRSSMIDTIQFLVNPVYGIEMTQLDMKKTNVVLEYVTPISRKYDAIILKPEENLYKGRVRYLLPLDLRFTSEAGKLEFAINFSYLSQDIDGNFIEQVRPIGYTTLEITETKNWSDYIPDTNLDNIAQIMLANQAIAEQNRINIEMATSFMPMGLKKDDKSIYLVNEQGNQVGESVSIESCGCEYGVPSVDFNVTQPDDIEDNVNNVVEF